MSKLIFDHILRYILACNDKASCNLTVSELFAFFTSSSVDGFEEVQFSLGVILGPLLSSFAMKHEFEGLDFWFLCRGANCSGEPDLESKTTAS